MELAFALSLLAKATAVTLPFVSPFLGPTEASLPATWRLHAGDPALAAATGTSTTSPLYDLWFRWAPPTALNSSQRKLLPATTPARNLQARPLIAPLLYGPASA
jgi:hypothetical protein